MNLRTTNALLFIFSAFALGNLSAYLVVKYGNAAEAKSYYFMASRYLDEGEYDLAAALLNQAIAKNPSEYGPYYLLGRMYLTKGNSRSALAMHNAALERVNAKKAKIDFYLIKCSIADIHLQAGDKGRGIRTYQQVVKEFPEVMKFLTSYLDARATDKEKTETEKQTELLYRRFLETILTMSQETQARVVES